MHRNNIADAGHLINAMTLRLERPAKECPIALLRLLLSDGYGPFYRDGAGDLVVRLDDLLANL